jgi:hypothetical protein
MSASVFLVQELAAMPADTVDSILKKLRRSI